MVGKTVIGKKTFLLVILFLLQACSSFTASEVKYSSTTEYDLLISHKRSELSNQDFKNWLVEQRRNLTSEREGVKGALFATGERGAYQDSAQSATGPGGTNDFNLQMTNLEHKRLQERLSNIDSKLRTLEALLSSASN